jgi:hypothetical protein
MKDTTLEQTTALLANDLGLETKEDSFMSEEDLLDALSFRVAEMIEANLDLLLSYMYRLDIDEGKILFALRPHAPVPPHWSLACLILERQKQRVATKMSYKPPIIDDEDLW